MKTTYFLLVRHGETDWNIQKLMQGHTDIPLNSTGLNQAKSIGKHLKKFHFDALYSSPLLRAYQTAQAIQKYHKKIPIVTRDTLKERSYGEFEGKTYDQISTATGRLHFSVAWNYPYLKPSGGEHLAQVQNRIEKFIQEALLHHQGKIIVVVSHGVALRILLGSLLRVPFPLVGSTGMNNASLSLIEYSGSRGGNLHFINYTEHLKI